MIDKYAELRTWASVRQLEYIEAIEKHGSMAKASKALGMNKGRVSDSMQGLKNRAALEQRKLDALQGHAPGHFNNGVAPGYLMGKVTVHRNELGQVKDTWERQSPDAAQREALMRAAVQAMVQDVPRAAPAPLPSLTVSHLCNLYTLTDSHVGSLCWNREGGADWDLKIAERILTGCFEQMVAGSPAAGVGIVAQLGDWLHQDSISPTTPTSHFVLDADGRFPKVVQIAVRILRRVVDVALMRHAKVIVLMAEGNHDISSSIWLRTLFAALYENEPRVEVIDSPLPYYVYEHGQTMLAWHHGHLKKNDQLPLLFAAQFPKVWGATTKRYAHCGHRHHVEEKEHSGMTVIQHPTLTARDAYAARGGWIAERQATAMTFHSTHGLVARNTVVPEMLDEVI
jgi:hypothetical protein